MRRHRKTLTYLRRDDRSAVVKLSGVKDKVLLLLGVLEFPYNVRIVHQRKPPSQNQLDSFGRFNAIPACDRHGQKDSGRQPVYHEKA